MMQLLSQEEHSTFEEHMVCNEARTINISIGVDTINSDFLQRYSAALKLTLNCSDGKW